MEYEYDEKKIIILDLRSTSMTRMEYMDQFQLTDCRNQ
jgi:hypothetical protein